MDEIHIPFYRSWQASAGQQVSDEVKLSRDWTNQNKLADHYGKTYSQVTNHRLFIF